MTRRWLAIVNPTAAAGRAGRRWLQLARALTARGVSYDLCQTTGPGCATATAARLAAGYDGIVAVGGDGTLHEIVNGLNPSHNALLAVAAYGTGNDFARSLDLPDDPAAFADLMVSARSRQVPVGIVRCAGMHGDVVTRRFINGVGAGLDAAVLRRLPMTGPRALAYLRGTLSALPSFQALPFTVAVDDHPHTDRLLLAYAALGRYAGGGMRLAPRAGDGRLHVVELRQAPLWRLLALLPGLYRGTFGSSGPVCTRFGRTATITSDGATAIEADGQLIGTTPFDVSVCDWTLNVVAGNGSVWNNGHPPSTVEMT